MPNIKHQKASWPTCLDDLRREPSRLVPPSGVARMGIVRSYDGLKSLPPPIRLPGGRQAWEGRAILDALGLSRDLPEEAETQEPRLAAAQEDPAP
jgi:hypothetical protein